MSPFVQELIIFPYDFADQDILENFVSMIKGISVNLPAEVL